MDTETSRSPHPPSQHNCCGQASKDNAAPTVAAKPEATPSSANEPEGAASSAKRANSCCHGGEFSKGVY